MFQGQAGYVLEKVWQLARTADNASDWKALLHTVSFFDYQVEGSEPKAGYSAPDYVLRCQNYLQRGLPAKAPPTIADRLETIFSSVEQIADYRSIIFKSLHLIDPQFDREIADKLLNAASQKNFSDYTNDLIYSIIPEFFGQEFMQVFSRNRSLRSLTSEAGEVYPDDPHNALLDRTLDITLELPYSANQCGLAISLVPDTPPSISDQDFSKRCAEVLEYQKWAPAIRITPDERMNIASKMREIEAFVANNKAWFDLIRENYRNPLYADQQGAVLLQVTLVPIAVARFQYLLLEAMRNGILKPDAIVWNIAVIERDLPCAHLALESLTQILEHLAPLHGETFRRPKIRLRVYHSRLFEGSPLISYYESKPKYVDEYQSNAATDLLIDISILRRSGLTLDEKEEKSKHIVRAYSAGAIHSARDFTGGKNICEPRTYENIEQALSLYFATTGIKETEAYGMTEVAKHLLRRENVLWTSFDFFPKVAFLGLHAILGVGNACVIVPDLTQAIALELALESRGIDCVQIIADTSAKTVLSRSLIFIIPAATALSGYKQAFAQPFTLYILDIQLGSLFGPVFHELYPFLDRIHQLPHCKALVAAGQPLTHEVALNLTKRFDLRFTVEDNPTRKGLQMPHLQIALAENSEFKKSRNTDNIVRAKTELLLRILENYLRLHPEKGRQRILVVCPESSPLSDDTDPKLYVSKHLIDNSISIPVNVLWPISDRIPATCGHTRELLFIDTLTHFATQDQVLISETGGPLGYLIALADHIIFFNIPGSVASLLYLCGSITSKKRSVLLFDNSPITVEEHFEQVQADGQVLCDEKISKSYFDLLATQKERNRRHPGIGREFYILDDVLANRCPPEYSHAGILEALLCEKTGCEVYMRLMPQNFPYRLHLIANETDLGYIDFLQNKKLVIQSDSEDIGFETVSGLFDCVLGYIGKHCPPDVDAFEWMLEKRSPGVFQSLAVCVGQNADEGPLRTALSFSNKGLEHIFLILNEKTPGLFPSLNLLSRFWQKHASPNDFMESLKVRCAQMAQRPDDNTLSLIEAHLARYRDYTNTLRCLGHLNLLGIIGDIKEVKHEGWFDIEVIPATDEQLLERVFNLFSEFFHPYRANQLFAQIINYPGNTVLEKCYAYLLSLDYNIVLPKIKRESDVLQRLCEAVADNDWIIKFNELAISYFSSRYAASLNVPNLVDDTQFMTEADFSILTHYLKLSENIDNLNHLYESCKILKNSALSENPVLDFLSAYTSLVIEEPATPRVEELLNELALSLVHFDDFDHVAFSEFLSTLQMLFSRYLSHFKEADTMNTLLHAMLYRNWLSNFTHKFLHGYERTFA